MIIGVDPGLHGACVVLIDGQPQRDSVVRAKTYQVDTSSVAKNRLDVSALHDDLMKLCPLNDATVYIEDPNVMMKNGATRIKTQFETIGMFKAVFELLGDPRIFMVQPVAWKKKYGLIKTKKRASVDRVHELFPDFGELLVKDADIAESVLIGRYGYKYIGI